MNTRKILTITIAAVALGTAAIAFADDAAARGGGRGGRHHHHHFHRSAVFISKPVAVSNCWKWINFKKVWICS